MKSAGSSGLVRCRAPTRGLELLGLARLLHGCMGREARGLPQPELGTAQPSHGDEVG